MTGCALDLTDKGVLPGAANLNLGDAYTTRSNRLWRGRTVPLLLAFVDAYATRSLLIPNTPGWTHLLRVDLNLPVLYGLKAVSLLVLLLRGD